MGLTIGFVDVAAWLTAANRYFCGLLPGLVYKLTPDCSDCWSVADLSSITS
ncbi:MAG: hypothetical protein M5F18_08660 [Asgard group archaeon]|nr:hypothetical protein [Asgard group archaeon]